MPRDPVSSWFASAAELSATAHYQLGQYDQAGALYGRIAKLPGVAKSLQSRAVQRAGMLGVDAVADRADESAAKDQKAMPRRKQRQPPQLRKPINMRKTRYGLYAALLALPLAGCGVFKGDGGPKTPTVGDRVSILSNDSQHQGRSRPPRRSPWCCPNPAVNAAWAQSGGNASKSMWPSRAGRDAQQVVAGQYRRQFEQGAARRIAGDCRQPPVRRWHRCRRHRARR